MTFSFDIAENLELKIKKLVKKDKKRADIVHRKIQEIINQDINSINHYKNLKHDFAVFKRVHIDKSFVLVFRVDEKKECIVFEDLDHHDNIYRR